MLLMLRTEVDILHARMRAYEMEMKDLRRSLNLDEEQQQQAG